MGGKSGKTTGKESAEKDGSTEAESAGEKKNTWDPGKRKLKFSYKEQKEYETIEQDIADLEQQIAGLEDSISVYASDFVKLQEINRKIEEQKAALDEKWNAGCIWRSWRQRLPNNKRKIFEEIFRRVSEFGL